MVIVTDKNAALVYNHFATRAGVAQLDSSSDGWFSDGIDLTSLPSEATVISTFTRKSHAETARLRNPKAIVGSCETLYDIFDFYETVAVCIGNRSSGLEIQKKLESQVKTWFINYPERLRNKKVLIIQSIKPLIAYGGYISDLVRMISARFFVEDFTTSLELTDILSWDPEVFILANFETTDDALGALRNPSFEGTRAFKRGAVYWIKGNQVSPENISPDNLFLLAACLTSCVGDLEAGYICQKGLFFKLAYMEMFKHKIDAK